jgi:hypothetical protein
MSIQTKAIEELRQFFGSYFHQDWDLAGSTPSEVLKPFFRNTPQEDRLKSVADSLRGLLDQFSSDTSLQTYIASELWCDYVPEGGRTRAWIKDLVGEIDAEVARRNV